MRQFTIGLSGHIDHGKTSIVKSLTGQNTDNLKDEIKRGLTIDIGFAHLNQNISIIDVPGHEKFIKNMVSGVNAIDSSLLVIAADDGIMPQTKEHFNILKILKINSGVIVINKIDLVDDEWLDLIITEVKSLTKDTFLENSKIIKVSTIKNIGLEKLKNEIINLSTKSNTKFDRGIFRMFVDRVFIKRGFGTVVTGTVLSGKVNDKNKLKLLPDNNLVNIRSIQTHNKNVSEVEMGSRTAINIQNIEKNKISRGSHLGNDNYFQLVNNAIVKIDILKKIKHNQRIRVHLGTQEVMARVLFADKKINKIGFLKFENNIVCTFKDRFIIRSFSPLITIGGGEVLDINIEGKWSERKIYISNLLLSKNKSDIIKEIINYRKKNIFNQQSLCYHLGVSNNILKKNLKNINEIIFLGDQNPWIITKNQLNENNNKILKCLEDYHKVNPYLNGLMIEQINQILILPDLFLKKILDNLCKKNFLKFNNDLYSIYKFKIQLSKNDQVIKKKLFEIIDSQKFQTSDFLSLIKELKIDEKKLKYLLNIEKNNNNFLIINGSLYFSQNNYINLLKSIKKYFTVNNTMTISDFKKIANTTRKYAVPLLEYLDKTKITYRDGNERKYNKK